MLSQTTHAQGRGKFFFLEGQLGLLHHGGIGGLGSLTFGMGGKVPGSDLRAYFMLEGGGSRSTQGEATKQDTERLYGQLGLRLLWPLRHTPVSVLMEGLLGGASSEATLTRPNRVSLRGSDRALLATAGMGVQIRMLQSLSITLRGQVQYNPDPMDELRRRMGLNRSAMFLAATGGVTWHF